VELHHFGIVVAQLEAAMARYAELFDYEPRGEPVYDPLQTVRVGLVAPRASGVRRTSAPILIEFIEPVGDSSRVAPFLKRGGGLHHVCYAVDDLEAALEHARGHGALVVHEPAPAVAFEGRRIAWLYTPDRQLVEFLERIHST